MVHLLLRHAAFISMIMCLAVSTSSSLPKSTNSTIEPVENLLAIQNSNDQPHSNISTVNDMYRRIVCFPTNRGLKGTDVNGCRPSLNKLRTFKDYAVKQDFVIGDYPRPRFPHPPPYYIHPYPSTCNLTIVGHFQGQRTWFSFKDVRTRATEIVQHCMDESKGAGGWSMIGEDVRGNPNLVFRVSVYGIDPVQEVEVS